MPRFVVSKSTETHNSDDQSYQREYCPWNYATITMSIPPLTRRWRKKRSEERGCRRLAKTSTTVLKHISDPKKAGSLQSVGQVSECY
uniref:Uncharacterized protein n=1 Tax=Heterorhabditis bacteriophora TaxID=37862 RepID=A0A1I7XVB3_HETBA